MRARITDNQLKTLHHLSVYKYLTISQCLLLGIRKYRSHMQAMLKELVDLKMVEVIRFGATPTDGKLEYIYCLSPKGKNILVNHFGYNESSIHYSKSHSYFKAQYHHRLSTILFHILFVKWIEENDFRIIFFDRDFDYIGNTRKTHGFRLMSKNRIDLSEKHFILPDTACMFTATKDKRILFLGEVTYGHDPGLVMKKMHNHLVVLKRGLAKLKYHHDKGHFVAWVFEKPELMKSVIKRMHSEKAFKDAQKFFLMKTLSDMKSDFFHGWHYMTGAHGNFLPGNTMSDSNKDD